MRAILIGGGMVAPTHLAALRDNTAGVILASVMGRDPARTARFTQQASDLLGHPVVTATDVTGHDLAIVITPPNARAKICRTLVAARIPTLLEKPVERTLTAARSIVSAYTDANIPLGICFQHRTRSAANALRDRLPELGRILHVDIRVPWWRDQAYYAAPGRGTYARDGGGVMINQAIHTLDLAIWLCGPVARLQAQMKTTLHPIEAEDTASALLSFASGASGTLFATTTAYPGTAESITISTDKAQITLTGDTLTIQHHSGQTQTIGGTSGTGGGADPMAFTHAWHQSVIEDFVRAVRTGKPPLASGAQALHVHAVIDTMTRAATTGQTEQVAQ